MRLTKLQSRILAFGMLFLVFIIGFLLTNTRKQIGTIPTVEISQDGAGSFEAKVVFGEFQKSEIKDGKKLWEIYAKTGRYSPERNIADLEFPVVTLYRNSDTTTLTASTARVHLTQTTLSKVDAQGDVVVHSAAKELTIKTSRALYDKEADSLHCPEKVIIAGPQGTIEGEDLVGAVTVKHFTFKKNVRTVLYANAKKSKKKTP